MKVLLLKDARIKHKAGEIVEVSPADIQFLLSLNIAEVLPSGAETEAPKKRVTRKKE